MYIYVRTYTYDEHVGTGNYTYVCRTYMHVLSRIPHTPSIRIHMTTTEKACMDKDGGKEWSWKVGMDADCVHAQETTTRPNAVVRAWIGRPFIRMLHIPVQSGGDAVQWDPIFLCDSLKVCSCSYTDRNKLTQSTTMHLRIRPCFHTGRFACDFGDRQFRNCRTNTKYTEYKSTIFF